MNERWNGYVIGAFVWLVSWFDEKKMADVEEQLSANMQLENKVDYHRLKCESKSKSFMSNWIETNGSVQTLLHRQRIPLFWH